MPQINSLISRTSNIAVRGMDARRVRRLACPLPLALLIVMALSLVSTATAAAAPEIVFGPSPRALDNRAMVATEHLPDWRALRRSGVGAVVLNPTFLLKRDPADGRPRPVGTWLTDEDLRDLAWILRRTGLQVIYEAGTALGHELCASGRAPVQIGELAAEREYDSALARLHRAGIPVAALNVDGPFLRLVAQSRKTGSCARATGSGLPVAEAVRAGRAYMIALRDLVARGNPGRDASGDDASGDGVVVNLLVNLPNWQVLDLPRSGGAPAGSSVDLREVMQSFVALQRHEPGGRLAIGEIVVDYPWAMVEDRRDLFRDRMRHLWNMTRDLNPGAAGPPFGIIVNTLSYTSDCGEAGPDRIPFLPWQRDGRAIPDHCLARQIGLTDTDANRDSDRDFVADSFAYAEALRPGGALAEALVTADGTRITDHLAHLYFQSWAANPVFNLWYMGEVIEYVDTLRLIWGRQGTRDRP